MAASLLHSYGIRVAGCEVLKHLNNLPEIDANDNNVETQNLASLQTIKKIYRELSNPTHPAYVAMKRMRDIPAMKYSAAMAGQNHANLLRANSVALIRGSICITGGRQL